MDPTIDASPLTDRVQRSAFLVPLWRPEGPAVGDAPIRLRQGSLFLGRKEADDGIAVPDGRVSSRHCKIRVAPGPIVTIEDLGSRNGTRVNGREVSKQEVHDRSVIRLGETFFLLRIIARGQQPDAEVPNLLGVAPEVKSLRAEIQKVAKTDLSVLILGESGSGKELVARGVHMGSTRHGSFVAINCSAIPANLAESRLFGHKAGAFTGAESDRIGVFEEANGGTIFLDEVGDLSPTIQPKLLRTLEDRTVVPVGSNQPVPVDVRIVAATNLNLTQRRDAGDFRGDLIARLSQFQLHVPPLRDRREDILRLFEMALEPTEAQRMSPELVERLLCYHWPYNVRELSAIAKELSVRGQDTAVLTPELVQHRFETAPTGSATAVETPASEVEGQPPVEAAALPPAPDRAEIIRLLTETSGNISKISKATGRSRKQVYRWLEGFGLEPEEYR